MNQMLEILRATIGQPAGPLAPPFSQWLGGTLRAVDASSASVEYQVRHEMTNPGGLLHGGVQSGMLDDVMGMLANALGREFFLASVNLSIDYLAAAREGDQVTATATVLRNGSGIVNMSAELRHRDGKLIARASSNLCNTRLPNPFK